MEISKSLQDEILTVQNKLKNAIRDHQICVGKLKDDPNNTDILGQIQKIHLHIVSLGRCQKQVVQRLRKEVETFKAENANGAKVSIASLLGQNNNNHITNNNETKLKNAGNKFNTKNSKEDYEEVVRNGDVPSPTQDAIPRKERRSSVETISGEDDVIEVSMDENSNEKSEKEESEKECKLELTEKINFLSALSLITTSTCAELQNRRAERKRRSTANPQFVYSSLEVPTKRKRHSYLQSGNVPQTRQTTARLNGPSPPPVKAARPKSTSPPSSRAVMKALIPVQKSTTRPNILRNAAESKVYTNKTKVENGPNQIQLPVPTVKSVQSIGNKAVHIPGLPSSLTIERISNDSAVCISCRNPGTLTICENCASNYHVSCHSISPAPSRICPKCALIEEEEIDDAEDGEEDEDERRPVFKKDEEFEEKERERYELRERNSDLRLQVYELEKRSQLLGQSLQLQHRTRQELLGKQEKTQRSIKRILDFIKLMQLRKSGDSHPPSASANCPPRPSSSQSLQTTSLHQPSTSRTLGLPQQSALNNEKMCPTPPSCSISCLDQVSPILTGQNLKCPTPTSYQSAVCNQKNISHTSSSKRSQNHHDGQVSLPKTKVTAQCSTTSCQSHQPIITPAFRPRSLSPSRPCSSVNSCPTPLIVTVRSKQIAQYPPSTASSIPRISPSRPSISWNDRRSTAESPGPDKEGTNPVLTSCDPPEPPKSYCLPTITPNPTNNCKSQSQPSQRKQACSVVVRNTGPDPVVLSTHCSQAITSPISSPIILESHETSVHLTKIPSSVGNSCIIKTTSWSQSNETNLRSSRSAVPSQNSSST